MNRGHDVVDEGDSEARAVIEAQAAQWVIRLGGDPLSPTEQVVLERWLAEDLQHRAAFEAAQSVWTKLDRLRLAPEARVPEFMPSRVTGTAGRRWLLRGVITLGGTAMLSVGLLWFGDPLTMIRADHRTGIGEVRTVLLEDGSSVELAPASAIAVDFDANARHVTLLSGTASFAAVPREKAGGRPFVVAADTGEARALGTRYVVEHLPDAVRVTVAEHDVAVSAPTAGGEARRAVVSPGQQIRYDAAGLGAVTAADPVRAEAWRRVPLTSTSV